MGYKYSIVLNDREYTVIYSTNGGNTWQEVCTTNSAWARIIMESLAKTHTGDGKYDG